MMKCKICNKKLKSLRGLGFHINRSHDNITKEEYYIKYIDQNLKKF